MAQPDNPRVLVDADVLFAGAASPTMHGASLVVLRMAEITLIDAIAPRQAVTEARRNLSAKLPDSLAVFRLLVDRCLRVVPDPSWADLEPHTDLAEPEDLPILVTALREGCPWLVTFNVRDFQPGHPEVTVLRPGGFLQHVRGLLTHLSTTSES